MQSSSRNVTTKKPTTSFLQAGRPSRHPTNSVKALKENLKHTLYMLNRIHIVSLQLHRRLSPDCVAIFRSIFATSPDVCVTVRLRGAYLVMVSNSHLGCFTIGIVSRLN